MINSVLISVKKLSGIVVDNKVREKGIGIRE